MSRALLQLLLLAALAGVGCDFGQTDRKRRQDLKLFAVADLNCEPRRVLPERAGTMELRGDPRAEVWKVEACGHLASYARVCAGGECAWYRTPEWAAARVPDLRRTAMAEGRRKARLGEACEMTVARIESEDRLFGDGGGPPQVADHLEFNSCQGLVTVDRLCRMGELCRFTVSPQPPERPFDR